MAWIDDRIWCHPKFTDLPSPAFRAYINGIAYSSGFGTRGHLSSGQLRAISATEKERHHLVSAGLWDAAEDGINIHDWDDHNAKRDARREADRERKRLLREAQKSAGQSAGQSPGTSEGTSSGASAGPSTLSARVETVETVDGSDFDLPEFVQRAEPLTLPSREGLPFTQALEQATPDQRDPFDLPGLLLDMLPDADQGTETVLRSFRLPEYAYRQAIEAISQRGGGVKLAVTVLKRVEAELLEQQAAGTNGNHAKDAWLDTLDDHQGDPE